MDDSIEKIGIKLLKDAQSREKIMQKYNLNMDLKKFEEQPKQIKVVMESIKSTLKNEYESIKLLTKSYNNFLNNIEIKSKVKIDLTVEKSKVKIDLAVEKVQNFNSKLKTVLAMPMRTISLPFKLVGQGVQGLKKITSSAVSIPFSILGNPDAKISDVLKKASNLGKKIFKPVLAISDKTGNAFKSIGSKISAISKSLKKVGIGINIKPIDISPLKILKSVALNTIFPEMKNNQSFKSISQSFNNIKMDFGKKAFVAIEPYLKKFDTWLKTNNNTINEWVTKAANGFGKIISIVAKVIDTFIQNWPQIQSVLIAVWNSIEPVFASLQEVIERIASWVIKNMPTIKAIMEEVFSVIGSVIKVVMDVFENLWNVWEKAWPSICNILEIAWTVIKPLIDLIINCIGLLGAIFEKVFPYIMDIVSFAWDFMKPIFEAIGKGLSFVSGIIGKFTKELNADSNININSKQTVDGSYATGLSYVPFDGFIAELHKGERVLTSAENKAYGKQSNTENGVVNKGDNTFNITINGMNKSTDEIINDFVTKISEAVNTMGEVLV